MKRIDTIRQRLVDRRRALLRQVDNAMDGLRYLDTHVAPELEEESQEENIARLLARLDDRGRAELDAIDDVLLRMERGDYGSCESCEEPIAVERLEALPTATLCISCAELRERERAATGPEARRSA